MMMLHIIILLVPVLALPTPNPKDVHVHLHGLHKGASGSKKHANEIEKMPTPKKPTTGANRALFGQGGNIVKQGRGGGGFNTFPFEQNNGIQSEFGGLFPGMGGGLNPCMGGGLNPGLGGLNPGLGGLNPGLG